MEILNPGEFVSLLRSERNHKRTSSIFMHVCLPHEYMYLLVQKQPDTVSRYLFKKETYGLYSAA